MKKTLLLILVAIASLSLVTGCGCSKKSSKEDNDKNFNTNEGVIEDKTVDGLKFINSSLQTSAFDSTLVTTVTNTTKEDVEVRIFNIYVKDSQGNVITTLKGYVGGVIPAGESREIVSSTTRDLSNATEISYELVK